MVSPSPPAGRGQATATRPTRTGGFTVNSVICQHSTADNAQRTCDRRIPHNAASTLILTPPQPTLLPFKCAGATARVWATLRHISQVIGAFGAAPPAPTTSRPIARASTSRTSRATPHPCPHKRAYPASITTRVSAARAPGVCSPTCQVPNSVQCAGLAPWRRILARSRANSARMCRMPRTTATRVDGTQSYTTVSMTVCPASWVQSRRQTEDTAQNGPLRLK